MSPASSETELTAVEAVAALHSGKLSAERYARALLDRAAVRRDLNAFRTLDRATVLEQARLADQRRVAGEPLGRLHGLPIPIKDSFNTRALPTSNGTPALKDFRPARDAPILERLFAEGAILMGKTNVHELSYGHTSNNLSFGAVRNPYDRSRVPGGSSGGSAAAVAARIAPLAVAEDTFGSIRIPASFCGIVGFRPSVGRYPGGGVLPISPRWDTPGPLARTVADLVLFDAVVTGDHAPVTAIPVRGARIGIADYLVNDLDPEVARVTDMALRRLEMAGAELVRTGLPEEIRAGSELTRTVNLYETTPYMSAFLAEHAAGVTFEEMIARAGPDVQAMFYDRVLPGAPNAVTREQYNAAVAGLDGVRAAARRYFDEHRVSALAFPVTRMPPPRIGEDREVEILGEKVPIRHAMGRNIGQGSCAGMPCLVLPAGLTADGLPVGLEFDAPAGQDRDLLAFGLALEKTLGKIPPPAA